MNTALFLMSTALVAGADPAPPVPAHPVAAAPAPVVAPFPGAPCGDCGAPCADACCEKEGLLSRLRARFHRNKADDCGCGAPVYAGFTTAGCNTCERHGWGSGPGLCSGPGLFSRLRGKFRKSGDCCDTSCDPCGGGPWTTGGGPWTGVWGGCALPQVPGAPVPAPAPAAPKEMPKPKETTGGTTAGSLHLPSAIPSVSVPSAPTIPAGGARNPF